MITTEDELFEDVKYWKIRAGAAEAQLADIISVYEYCSEDPVDRGWGPLSDCIEDARHILAAGDVSTTGEPNG
jgi:hypothetical protein